MRKPKILIADNNKHFLGSLKDLLRTCHYDVIAVKTAQDAAFALDNDECDVAILDIRLRDDNDEHDTSGLEVARMRGCSIPKIILTQFGTVDLVAESMRPRAGYCRGVVNFINKEENEKLLEAIETALSQRVFIVHGHDNYPKEAVARYLEQSGLFPIILHEQENRGDTIIEKIERYSNVKFAIVLLTPDDEGRSKSDDKLEDRARQNVIFELGYFIAMLGRNKVRALIKDDIVIPSDYLGVLNITLDEAGAWKEKLKKELRAEGINIL